MVVGSYKLFIAFLTDFRCYGDFRIRVLKLKHFVQALIFRHSFKTGAIGSRVIFYVFHLWIDSNSVLKREALFADITVPTYGISFVQCIVDSFNQFIQRKIIHRLVLPVVRYLGREHFIIRFVGEAGQFYVIIHIQSQAFGERLRCIFLSFISEFLRQLTQIRIEQIIDKCIILRSTLFRSDICVYQSLEIT